MLIPQTLVRSLGARECVAFVGAGFSVPAGMPQWGRLFSDLLDLARQSVRGQTPESLDLLRLCEAAVARGDFLSASVGVRELIDPTDISRHLQQAFSNDRLREQPNRQQQRMLSRVKNLVAGPWAGVITTNFDSLIEAGIGQHCHRNSPFRATGEESSLGHILCTSAVGLRFFVKLHGDSWSDKLVLCSDDYIRAWQLIPRITSFLSAAMLRYRFVFIGCSLEDEVVKLRMRLRAEFGGAIPPAYALMPSSDELRLRGTRLRREAAIEVLSYDAAVGQDSHSEVDSFLSSTALLVDGGPSVDVPRSISELRSLDLEERFGSVGELNRALLRVVHRQPNHSLPCSFLYSPQWDGLDLGIDTATLARMSEAERIYRMHFLCSVDVVAEKTRAGERLYFCPENPDSQLVN